MFFLFRYKLLLNEEQKGLAIAHLSKIWSHMKSLSACTEGDSVPSTSAQNNLREEAEGDQDECTDPVELMLRQRESERRQSSAERSGETPIKDLLESYYNEERIDKKSNVLMYWESQKIKEPELFLLSQVVLALPVTQVSVERAYSGLKFILSDLRSNLSADIL